ncbi:MAG: dephospho-CoA kinase [Synergistaceae bacterium]|nr:dephospho-CoA kinase [Synergistaceae bacterium]
MSIVGLTGDVGAGKSTLCKEWGAMGAHIIDADSAARALWDEPDIQREAEKRWGTGFFDAPHKELWAKIAAKIFTDEEEYRFAAALLHKRTIAELKRRAAALDGVVVVEIPLLYEGGHEGWLDYVVYAAAPFERRVERNAGRGWDAEELSRRERKLLPSAEKMSRADFVLINDGSEEEWREKARKLGAKLLTL